MTLSSNAYLPAAPQSGRTTTPPDQENDQTGLGRSSWRSSAI